MRRLEVAQLALERVVGLVGDLGPVVDVVEVLVAPDLRPQRLDPRAAASRSRLRDLVVAGEDEVGKHRERLAVRRALEGQQVAARRLGVALGQRRASSRAP